MTESVLGSELLRSARPDCPREGCAAHVTRVEALYRLEDSPETKPFCTWPSIRSLIAGEEPRWVGSWTVVCEAEHRTPVEPL